MENILQVISESGHVHVINNGLTLTFRNCIVERVRPKEKDKETSFIVYDKHKIEVAVFTTNLDINEAIL